MNHSNLNFYGLLDDTLCAFAHCRMVGEGLRSARDFTFIHVNRAFEHITGLRDVVGRPLKDLVPRMHELDPDFLRAIARVVGSGVSERFECELKALGIWAYVAIHRPASGEFVLTLEDISERKCLDARLDEVSSRARLMSEALDRVPVFVYMKDREGRYTYGNHAALKIAGRTAEQFFGSKDEEYFAPDVVARLQAIDARVLNDGETTEEKIEIWSDRLCRRVCQEVKHPIRDERGQVTGLFGISADVTRHHVAEERAKVESERMRLAERLAHFGVFEWRLEKDAQLWSPELSALYGLGLVESEQSIESWLSSVHSDDRARVLRNWQEALINGEYRDEFRVLWPDGTTRYLVAGGHVYYGPTGEAIRVVGFNVDVTAQKEAEREQKLMECQMREGQKLESLGLMAGGIAHDFNNLLAGVMGNTSIALTQVDRESSLGECLESIQLAAERAADLTRQMLAYAGKGQTFVKVMDLSQLVGEMAALLGTVISKKAALKLDLAQGIPNVELDPTQIRQVVMNLITNASDALGHHCGTIRVRTGYTQSSGDSAESVSGVYLEVSDTGCGMNEETRTRMFDPFFTTKFSGRGLGLASVLGIVRGHKGVIQVKSAEGEGTTVRVLFPATQKHVLPKPRQAIADSSWQGKGTILVVDDEEFVRTLFHRILTPKGFHVLTAADGEAGLRIFQERLAEVSLVMLDMTMPRMGGEEVYRAMRELRASTPIVLMSGYCESDVMALVHDKLVEGFLQKPFQSTHVLEVVRRVMGGGENRAASRWDALKRPRRDFDSIKLAPFYNVLAGQRV